MITPIQLPVEVESTLPSQSTLSGRYNCSTTPQSKATFAVVKSTTIQHAIGHPLAYARVLMQVSEML